MLYNCRNNFVRAVKTKSEILKILKEELPYIREKFHVKSIGLFGSYVRGEQEEGSDIDMLVEFGSPWVSSSL
jgi:hypothetical protein